LVHSIDWENEEERILGVDLNSTIEIPSIEEILSSVKKFS